MSGGRFVPSSGAKSLSTPFAGIAAEPRSHEEETWRTWHVGSTGRVRNMGFRPLDSPFSFGLAFFDFFSCFMYLEASHRLEPFGQRAYGVFAISYLNCANFL